jgi:triphosphatase
MPGDEYAGAEDGRRKMHPRNTREQEWQFAASDLDAAREWIARQPAGYSVRRFAPRATLELHDTYFDSADWMIFRAGFALRVRQELAADGTKAAEITLKALRPARDGFASRTEFTERAPAADLPGVLAGDSALAERVRALVGRRELAPLFSARTRRERQQLLEADTELPLAEVDLDHTSLETPGGATREFTRVEVECLNAEPAVLEPLVEQLRTAAQLEPANESKFRLGLSVAGLDPTAPWSGPQRALTARTPFDAAIPLILSRYFARVLEREPEVRMGAVEAVHEMRVATRHLDVLLKSFAKYAPSWAVRSRRTVRGLVKALGVVRDCDVQLAFLAGSHAAATDALRARIEADRRDARRELLELLDAGDTREWFDAWRGQLVAVAPDSAGLRAVPTAVIARDLIRAQHRKLRKRADAIGGRSSPDEYHEVRIRAKRLRYTLDAFKDLYGAAAEDYAHALARFQTVLGAYHDATVRAERFTALAGGELPAATSFAVGRIVERDANVLDRCRARFPKAWRRVRRRRWRALQEAMGTAIGAGT